ncbi:MAG: hypothetical protein IGR76_12720 [Synechococcales cyanobacterium T60_A2020_003]|nr:hypothetical protein [Synechococcales cyanobacterium T60_A2020_003]
MGSIGRRDRPSFYLILSISIANSHPLWTNHEGYAIAPPPREADEIDDNENSVIVVGFGCFGQIVGRLLLANGCRITVLEHSPE